MTESTLKLINEVSADYPENLFSPAGIELDLDNDDYMVYVVKNSLHSQNSRHVDASQVEVVFDKKNELSLVGHYLRFYGDRKKIKSIIKKVDIGNERKLALVSKDFFNATIFDEKETFCMEFCLRERNYYAVNFIKKTNIENSMLINAIASAKKNFLKIQDQRKKMDAKTSTAAKKLISALASN